MMAEDLQIILKQTVLYREQVPLKNVLIEM